MSISNSTSDLARIHRLLEERFPEPFPLDRTPEEASLPTGLPRLDALLPAGGLPRGALIEISGEPSSGKTSLTLAIIAAVQGRAEAVAYVDPSRTFHAPAAAAAQVDLEHLLLVRPARRSRRPPDSLAGFRVLDHLLRSKGFSLLVLDLSEHLQLPPLDRLFRISRLARVGETVALLLTESAADRPSLGSPISLRLAVTRTGFRFAPGSQSPFALGGTRISVTLRKNKFGPPGGAVSLELNQGTVV